MSFAGSQTVRLTLIGARGKQEWLGSHTCCPNGHLFGLICLCGPVFIFFRHAGSEEALLTVNAPGAEEQTRMRARPEGWRMTV